MSRRKKKSSESSSFALSRQSFILNLDKSDSLFKQFPLDEGKGDDHGAGTQRVVYIRRLGDESFRLTASDIKTVWGVDITYESLTEMVRRYHYVYIFLFCYLPFLCFIACTHPLPLPLLSSPPTFEPFAEKENPARGGSLE